MPLVYNGHKITNKIRAARYKRVHVVTIFNSNGFYENYGVGKALEKASFEYLGQWATGYVGFGYADNQGYKWSKLAFPADVPLEIAAAPDILNLWPVVTDLKLFQSYGNVLTTFNSNGVGISLPADSFIPCQANLSVFIGSCFDPIVGTGNFTPQARTDGGFGPNLTGSLVSVLTGGGIYDLFETEWQIAANVNRAGRTFEGGLLRATGSPVAINGLAYFNTIRLVNRDKTNGFSTTSLYAVGGASAFDAATALRAANATSGLSTAFTRFRSQMPDGPVVLVLISLRLNDRNELSPSIETGITPGNSKAAYKENVADILNTIDLSYFGDPAELGYILDFEHDSATPRTTQENEFLQALQEISDSRNDTCVTDINAKYPYSVFLANGWFDSLGNDHLEIPGYDASMTAIFDALMGLDNVNKTYFKISGGL